MYSFVSIEFASLMESRYFELGHIFLDEKLIFTSRGGSYFESQMRAPGLRGKGVHVRRLTAWTRERERDGGLPRLVQNAWDEPRGVF